MLALGAENVDQDSSEDATQEETKTVGGLGVKVRSGHNLNALALE